LGLLFKSVSQQALDVQIQTPLVSYLTELKTDAMTVPLEAPDVQVSEDPIRWQREHLPGCQSLPLLQTVPLAAEKPCTLSPVLCDAPVFKAHNTALHQVSFENAQWTVTHQAPLEPIQTQARQTLWPRMGKPDVKGIPIQPIQARRTSLREQAMATQARENPRFFALPIRKTPIPPFRFPPEIRERFRQALAVKEGTTPGNVQLKVIFQRMNVALYTTVQQDEQGHLLCVPKNELMGRNLLSKSGQLLLNRLRQNSENTYLVVGFRLDNQKDIRTMVPVSALK
jgi:hypothetical protein